MYGAKFADHWSGVSTDLVRATWGEALATLTRHEIGIGLRALVQSGKPFPPTLPEFYGLCRPRVEVPPLNDHVGLDALARQLRVSTAGIDSYFALRQAIFDKLREASPRLTSLELRDE